ncbi:hypothetical protein [Streptomyces sp. 5-10]|uniref:hypothetical protein n=1 Tax=Streptomyces sp. 5-10 TaxID=878925 RepID=UPI00168BE9AB|nr:hypothetical protein [Streptomyces sp. 5-10]MBD3004765.1 hypothetical protein [Streptomyces sp. 5-10]
MLERVTGAARAREMVNGLKAECRKAMVHDAVLAIEELMATDYKRGGCKSEQVALGKAIRVLHQRMPLDIKAAA